MNIIAQTDVYVATLLLDTDRRQQKAAFSIESIVYNFTEEIQKLAIHFSALMDEPN